MSLSTTSGFLYEPNIIPLLIAIGVNLTSTFLKLSDKSSHAQGLLISSFVADLHLISAMFVLTYMDNHTFVLALAIGAVISNLYATFLMLIESSKIDEDYYYDY